MNTHSTTPTKYEPMNTGLVKVDFNLGNMLEAAIKGDMRQSVGYFFRGKRYPSYEEASAAWGKQYLVRNNIKPIKLGVYPFFVAKELGVPVKSLPIWKEYSNTI